MRDKEGTELAIGDIVIASGPLRRLTIERMTPTKIAYQGLVWRWNRVQRRMEQVVEEKYLRGTSVIKVGHVDVKPTENLPAIPAIPQ